MTLDTDISSKITSRIQSKIPDAQIEVICNAERHYSLTVISKMFADLSQVKRHQLVYSAITDLMSGDDAPVHAIDRMDVRTH